MEYTIFKDTSSFGLEIAINLLITEGWTPLGGVSISMDGRYTLHYAQAMIKDK